MLLSLHGFGVHVYGRFAAASASLINEAYIQSKAYNTTHVYTTELVTFSSYT